MCSSTLSGTKKQQNKERICHFWVSTGPLTSPEVFQKPEMLKKCGCNLPQRRFISRAAAHFPGNMEHVHWDTAEVWLRRCVAQRITGWNGKTCGEFNHYEQELFINKKYPLVI
jgi:hypothetical protein